MSEEQKSESLGRNEPCPCGSGKKYKRCHGVSAAPKLGAPAAATGNDPARPGVPGMPSMDQFDPQALMQMSQLLQRLPRGQMQRLQAIMQKAMAGKDVSREAAEFERTLPPNFKDSLQQMMPAFAGAMGKQETASEEPVQGADMDVEEAKRLVAEAAASGQISKDQADELLQAAEAGESSSSAAGPSGFGKLWGKLTGKKA